MQYQDLRVPQQQTTDYFQAVRGSLQAFQDGSLGVASQGIGQAMIATTPIVAAARAVKRNRVPMNGAVGQNGLGQSDGFGALAVVAAVLVVTAGALSYQAGKAMSPNRNKAKTWGWVGVPVGLLTGPWGLGVMGIVSNSSRK